MAFTSKKNLNTGASATRKDTDAPQQQLQSTSTSTNTNNGNIKSNSKKNVSNCLISLSKEQLQNRDIYGRCLIHIICLTNRYDYLSKLLKNPNLNISITDYENQWNCLHYAIFYKNYIIAKILLNLPNYEQLIKAKDKEGFTPLDLLSSETDLQKLQWVPISIGRIIENSSKIKKKRDHREIYDKYSIHDVNLQNRFNNSENHTNQHNNNNINNNNIWFDKRNRGASELIFTEFKDTLSDSFKNQKLNKVDLSTLKLGYGDDLKYPKLSERISLPRISDIKMSKSHTVILTCESIGNIFISGLGTRGRLGLGNTQPQESYVSIPFLQNYKIIDVDLSNDHTIVLNSKNQIFTWGSNTNGQLGYQTDTTSQLEPVSLLPKQLITGDFKKISSTRFLGVSCSKYHSLAYTKDEIYLWGMNIGQFGFNTSPHTSSNNTHLQSSLSSSSSSSLLISSSSSSSLSASNVFIQASPKKLQFSYGIIKQVHALDFATVVLTENDEIHIYRNGFHTKVQPPLFRTKILERTFDAFKPRVLSKRKSVLKLITAKNCQNIVMLYDNGDILEFIIDLSARNSNELLGSIKFNTIWSPSKEHLRCSDVDVSNDGSIIICVKDGSVYRRIKRNAIKNSNVSKRFKFGKLPNLNKVVKVITDPLFSKFAFLRDDIDLIPHRLPKSSLFGDITRLSPLSESVPNRLQNILMDTEYNSNNENSFVTDFVYKTKLIEKTDQESDLLFGHTTYEDDDDEDDDKNDKTGKQDSVDLLFNKYRTRWSEKYHSSSKNSIKVYQKLKDSSDTKDLLESDDLEYDLSLKGDLTSNKFYDLTIVIKNEIDHTEYELQAHRELLTSRSEPLRNLIKLNGNPLIKDGITIEYKELEQQSETNEISQKSQHKILLISGKITLRAVLLVINLIYTDKFVDIWAKFPVGKAPSDISKSRKPFDSLVRLLRLIDPLGNVHCESDLMDDLKTLMIDCDDHEDSEEEEEEEEEDDSEGNEDEFGDENDANMTTIILKDGKIKTYFPILIARSVYFETMFSSRWTPPSQISFPHIESLIFQIVLKYLYGENYLSLFDEIENINNIPVLINIVLDVIQVADELLLFELLDICQLYLKDFINIDNVIVLLQHAYNHKADKLFENCLWFICNNLDYFLFDNEFNELINDFISNQDFIKRLDTGLKWFKSLKINDRSQISNSHMIFKSNETFLNQFIFQLSEFNREFLHPILSEEWGTIIDPIELNKSSSSPSSSNTMSSSTTERRRRSSTKRIEDINSNIPGATRRVSSITQSLLSLRENSSESNLLNNNSNNESAIDDNDNDNNDESNDNDNSGFLVVTSKRGKRVSSVTSSSRNSFGEGLSIGIIRASSISKERSSSPPISLTSNIGETKPNSPAPWSTTRQSHTPTTPSNSTIISLNSPSTSSPLLPPSVSSTTSTTPVSNTSTTKAEFLTLSESVNNGISSNSDTPVLKATSGNSKIRVSQKERIRQMKEVSVPVSSAPLTSRSPLSPWSNSSTVSSPSSDIKYKNPWGIGSSDEVPKSSSSSSILSSSPSSSSTLLAKSISTTSSSTTFASKVTQKPKVNFAPLGATLGTSSLEAMQLQEILQQVENEKETVRTLDEIRQEEEFAMWWAEESAKVQKQMQSANKSNSRRNGSTGNQRKNSNNNNNNNNSNDPGKSKQSKKKSSNDARFKENNSGNTFFNGRNSSDNLNLNRNGSGGGSSSSSNANHASEVDPTPTFTIKTRRKSSTNKEKSKRKINVSI